MRILFTYFPLFVDFSHAAALLTAICKQRGIDADYAPATLLQDKIQDYDIVAFSLVTDLDFELCKPYMARAMESGKLVLAGGVYARRGGYISPSLAHSVCRGEAETIPDFLLNGDASIFERPYFHKSLDGLPMPDLSHVRGNEFHREFPFLQGLKMIPYQTSRGCPHQCSFCETQFQPKMVRMKHTIRDDVQKLQREHNPDLLYIFDELPPYYSREWRDQWAGLYAPFLSYIRADIEPEHLEFLIAHGLKVAAFGVESTDEDFRNTVLNKNVSDAHIKTTTSILRKHGVTYIPFYMTGIPEEVSLDVDKVKEIGGYPITWQYQNLKDSVSSQRGA